MRECYSSEVYRGLTIEIVNDTDYDYDWSEDESIFLVTTRNRYFCVERKGFEIDKFRDPKTRKQIERTHHVLPLYAYIHSGVALSLGQGYPFNDQWDAGQIGFALASKADWPRKGKKLDVALKGTVETWNDVLSGNVWGYVVDDADGDHLDSCWGFIGSPNGYILQEARQSADWFADKAAREREALVETALSMGGA